MSFYRSKHVTVVPHPLPMAVAVRLPGSRRTIAPAIVVVLLITALTIGTGRFFWLAGRQGEVNLRPVNETSVHHHFFLFSESQFPITSLHTKAGTKLHGAHSVLLPPIWPRTVWGRNCSDPRLSVGEHAMCQLPLIWKNCSQGIYLDIGTNVGAQIRKLYDPWQFPGATVLGLFSTTYGVNRSGVCAIGVEANPVHTPYLAMLNAYFKRKGYQAIVLPETAASIRTGKVTFYQDHGSPQEWGASLAQGAWQRQNASIANQVQVTALDLAAFVADIVRPLTKQVYHASGNRPPVGMKMDVEGAEYAILPGLIVSGGLCDLDMMYLEPHRREMRVEDGRKINMTIAEMETVFHKLRLGYPDCSINYSHLDDETYLRADTEVPLPP